MEVKKRATWLARSSLLLPPLPPYIVGEGEEGEGGRMMERGEEEWKSKWLSRWRCVLRTGGGADEGMLGQANKKQPSILAQGGDRSITLEPRSECGGGAPPNHTSPPTKTSISNLLQLHETRPGNLWSVRPQNLSAKPVQ